MKATEIETMKPVIPYNLQMFADGDGGDAGDNPDSTSTENNPGDKAENPDPEPTDKDKINELMAELAKVKAESQRNKSALDKEMSKNKQLTSDLRAKLTAEEQAQAEKEEAEREQKERLEKAEAELNRMKAVQAYKAIDNEETVNTLIDAINDKDHTSVAQILDNEIKRAVAIKEAEWKKSRPPIESGNGTGASMTVEEIMAIKDPAEQVKAIAQHKALFEKH